MVIHLSGLPGGGVLRLRAGRPCPLFNLAPGGVYLADQVTPAAGALLPHRFTLTCTPKRAIGGLFSVALSCRSPRLAVSQHPALWSPDLPRPGNEPTEAVSLPGRDHPADSPSPPSSHTGVSGTNRHLLEQVTSGAERTAKSTGRSWSGVTMQDVGIPEDGGSIPMVVVRGVVSPAGQPVIRPMTQRGGNGL